MADVLESANRACKAHYARCQVHWKTTHDGRCDIQNHLKLAAVRKNDAALGVRSDRPVAVFSGPLDHIQGFSFFWWLGHFREDDNCFVDLLKTCFLMH